MDINAGRSFNGKVFRLRSARECANVFDERFASMDVGRWVGVGAIFGPASLEMFPARVFVGFDNFFYMLADPDF